MVKKVHKILIIGDACRGKSTLASRISKKLGIPFHSTDDYLYEIKYTKYKDKQNGIDEISKIYHDEKWIVEGTTYYLLQPGFVLADIIIDLRYSNIFSQWLSLMKRHFLRKDKSFLQTLRLMRHVLYKRYGLGYRKGQGTHTERVAPYKNKVVTLTSFKDINNFVNSID